jgi:hypothetical protein
MINIFEVFLPQLLRYPNPNDPLNGEAAALLMRHPKEYDAKVKGEASIITEPGVEWLNVPNQSMYNDMPPKKQPMPLETATRMKTAMKR